MSADKILGREYRKILERLEKNRGGGYVWVPVHCPRCDERLIYALKEGDLIEINCNSCNAELEEKDFV